MTLPGIESGGAAVRGDEARERATCSADVWGGPLPRVVATDNQDAIDDTLDAGLPRAYTPDIFKAKAGVVFQHVYERYAMAA